MATEYLDKTGLAYFWSKIKSYGNTHWGGGGGSVLDFYPVGSYYETSDTSFDPNVTWGGTWSLETAGKFHVSAGTGYTAGSTGGSPYIQAHTHSFTNPQYQLTQTTANGGNNAGHWVAIDQALSWGTGKLDTSGTASYKYLRTSSSGGSVTRSNPIVPAKDISLKSGGGGSVGAINTSGLSTGTAGNMPPYVAVNRWHRTA